MVFGLKKFLFKGGAGSPANLPEDVRQALADWRASKAPAKKKLTATGAAAVAGTPEGIARGRALIAELSLDDVIADVGSAANAIASAGKIGVVGYCWGGTIALLSAIPLGLPAVSY